MRGADTRRRRVASGVDRRRSCVWRSQVRHDRQRSGGHAGLPSTPNGPIAHWNTVSTGSKVGRGSDMRRSVRKVPTSSSKANARLQNIWIMSGDWDSRDIALSRKGRRRIEFPGPHRRALHHRLPLGVATGGSASVSARSKGKIQHERRSSLASSSRSTQTTARCAGGSLG